MFAGAVWPSVSDFTSAILNSQPNQSAAGVRTRSLLNICVDEGWDVSFASVARPGLTPTWFKDENVTAIHCNDPNEMEKQLCEVKPDIVVFDQFGLEEMVCISS